MHFSKIKKFKRIQRKLAQGIPDVVRETTIRNAVIYTLQLAGYPLIMKEVASTNKEIFLILNKIFIAGETNIVPFTFYIDDTRYIQYEMDMDLYAALTQYTIKSKHHCNVVRNVIQRILIGLLSLRRHKILHCDLHAKNIFISDVPKSKTTYSYELGKVTVDIAAAGIDIVLGDFDQAQIMRTILQKPAIDFFKYYFPLLYLAEKNNFLDAAPNGNIYFIDLWRILHSLIGILQPTKCTNELLDFCIKYRDIAEKAIGKVFGRHRDIYVGVLIKMILELTSADGQNKKGEIEIFNVLT